MAVSRSKRSARSAESGSRRYLVLAALTLIVLAGGGTLALRAPTRAEAPARVRTVVVPSGPPVTIVTDTLRRGQTLGRLFDAHGLSGPEAVRVINALRQYKSPRSLRPGTIVELTASVAVGPARGSQPLVDGPPSRILLQPDPDARVVLDAVEGGWVARVDSVPIVLDTVRVAALISSNLYDAALDGDTIGLQRGEIHQLIWSLSDIFGWQIDFYRDIRSGDAYRSLVEREVRPDGSVRSTRVLAAEFRNRDRVVAAVRFETPEGRTEYYDLEGESVRRAFLRAPLDFRRVTSRFSRRRFHPVLRRYRAHLGTDYGAPTGTPVRATGDGVVTRAGWWGGYGKMVEIRHANGYSTRYAHLSRVSVPRGRRVAQGEVIGRVGSTGLSTAPHLHYEFLKDGSARNPASIDLPPAEPVADDLRQAFFAQRDEVLQNLAALELPSPSKLANARSANATAE